MRRCARGIRGERQSSATVVRAVPRLIPQYSKCKGC